MSICRVGGTRYRMSVGYPLAEAKRYEGATKKCMRTERDRPATRRILDGRRQRFNRRLNICSRARVVCVRLGRTGEHASIVKFGSDESRRVLDAAASGYIRECLGDPHETFA